MRLNLAGDSVEQQISDLLRDVQEIKTKQFTSQNSGMLGHTVRAADRDSFGDIVQLSGSFVTPPNPTSRIPCIATPSPSHFNSIYCYQKFIPIHGKPAVVVPYIKLFVKSGGLTGESRFMLVGYRFIFVMEIYNAAREQVGSVNIIQDLGDYLRQVYDPDTPYAYQTVISYTSTVPFELSYNLFARSSDTGYIVTECEGLFF